jgi:hypothetical protein
MKENKQIKIINSIVFLTGILLISVSIQKLFLTKGSYQASENSIGAISFLENDIRLKKTNYFEWFKILSPDNQLNINDKIFSNTGSKATIKLNSGHQIKLQEQSLIKIKDSNSIKIQKGLAVITLKKGDRPLNVFIGKKKIQLKTNSDSTVSINHGIKTTIEVDQGELEVITSNKSLKVQKEKPLFLDAKESLVQTQLKYPENQNLYTKTKALEILFKFSPKEDNSKILLSKTNSFVKPKILEPKLSHSLVPGTYYWRVGETPPNHFKVIRMVPPPSIKNSGKLENIFIYSDKTKISGTLLNPFKASLVALYTDKLNLIKEITTQDEKFEFSNILPGRYIIKAKQNQNYLQSNWSQGQEYLITKLEESPGEALIIELKRPNQEVKFEWKKEKKDLSLFEVSDSPNFKRILISKRIRSKNFTHIKFPVVGTFYWRANKLDKDGSRTKQVPLKVIIRPTPAPSKPKSLPTLKLKMKYKKKRTSLLQRFYNLLIPSALASDNQFVELKFPKIENAKSYQIQIFKDKESKILIKSINTTSTTINWTPPQTGNYYWKISYTDHWNRKSPFSDSSSLKVVFDEYKKKPEEKNKIVKKQKDVEQFNTQGKTKVQFLLGPSSISFSQKILTSNAKNISIEGQVYDSREITLEHDFESAYLKSIFSSYFTQGGKVFNGQDYQHRRMKLGALTYFYNLSFLISANQLTTYKIDDELVLNDEVHYDFSIGLEYRKALIVGKKHKIEANLGFSGLANLDYSTGLSYEYNYNSKYKALVSAKYFNGQFDHSEIDINYQCFQLLIGLSSNI